MHMYGCWNGHTNASRLRLERSLRLPAPIRALSDLQESPRVTASIRPFRQFLSFFHELVFTIIRYPKNYFTIYFKN